LEILQVIFFCGHGKEGFENMDTEMLAQILEELHQIKQDVRWLREREEGRQTADHDEMAENLAALGRSIERLKR
jgi:hypothetical protein